MNAGIYVHIPFCIKKCSYCNFYSITEQAFIDSFSRSLIKEITKRRDKDFICDTIYFGGGTPTLLPSDIIAELISVIRRSFRILPDSEITIEANPGTIDRDYLYLLREAGINRLNIGIQSFDDANLKILGRSHTAKEARTAYEEARGAGFSNVGIDIIYAISGQTLKDMIEDLKQAVDLDPEHISSYMLTLEPATIMYGDVIEGILKKTDEDLERKMFLSTVRFLKNFGYRQYEISNFAKADYVRSAHNLKYWTGSAYKGFGPAAHSFDKNRRYWNISDVEEYIEKTNVGKSVVEGAEILTKEERIIEFVYLGLRHSGIDIKRFNFEFGADFIADYHNILEELIMKRFIKIDRDLCVLTEKGMLIADSVASILVSK